MLNGVTCLDSGMGATALAVWPRAGMFTLVSVDRSTADNRSKVDDAT